MWLDLGGKLSGGKKGPERAFSFLTLVRSYKHRITHLLDYLHTHKDATIRYVASDMVLNIHSDA